MTKETIFAIFSTTKAIARVILITLLQYILRIVQLPENWREIFEAPESLREIVYGVAIIAIMILYGREKSKQS